MASDAIAFWGCGRGNFLDVWNCARTAEYVRKYSPQAWKTNINECCPDFDFEAFPPPENAADPDADDYLTEPYTNPVDDDAWWYDVTRPESAGFLGFQVYSITGRYGNTRAVTVSSGPGCDNSNQYNVLHTGQIITVEAIAHGVSCCAIAYGIRALRQLLSGCGCENECGGTQLVTLDCIPDVNAEICTPVGDGFVLPDETTSPWRLLKNAKLLEEPQVVDARGPSCGNCGCARLTKVRWTFAADAGAYLPQREVLPLTNILLPANECEVLCDDECEPSTLFLDPNCPDPIYIAPGDTDVNCFCEPIIRSQQCFEIDLMDRMFESELEFVVNAGGSALRNFEVRIWNKFGNLGYDSSIYTNCNQCAGFTVSFVPHGGRLSRTVCGAVTQLAAATNTASGVLGGPNSAGGDTCVRLGCGEYIICVIADAMNTADDANITINVREFEP